MVDLRGVLVVEDLEALRNSCERRGRWEEQTSVDAAVAATLGDT